MLATKDDWTGGESYLCAQMETALSPLTGATPELLQERGLLRRIDSKFVLRDAQLEPLVRSLDGRYAVLRVPQGSVARYESLYLDSPDLRFYHDHRRGRRLRHKVRFRHYPDREVSFLEVKTKQNDLVTDKHRLDVEHLEENPGQRESEFLRARVGALADCLAPTVRIHYRRVCLVGIDTDERVTLDFELELRTGEGTCTPLHSIAVVEVKQPSLSTTTPIMRALSRAGVRPVSMSKYAVAIVRTRPRERHNRFLPQIKMLERIAR